MWKIWESERNSPPTTATLQRACVQFHEDAADAPNILKGRDSVRIDRYLCFTLSHQEIAEISYVPVEKDEEHFQKNSKWTEMNIQHV